MFDLDPDRRTAAQLAIERHKRVRSTRRDEVDGIGEIGTVAVERKRRADMWFVIDVDAGEIQKIEDRLIESCAVEAVRSGQRPTQFEQYGQRNAHSSGDHLTRQSELPIVILDNQPDQNIGIDSFHRLGGHHCESLANISPIAALTSSSL